MAALKNIRRSDALTQGRLLLDRLGLGRDADGLIATYSGGMRRRLGLAQASYFPITELLLLGPPVSGPEIKIDAMAGVTESGFLFSRLF